ncbi:MAG: DUF892 family protein [Verrucomicrobiota bacterium]
MKIVTPENLLFDQLQDLHSVESQLLDSLPTLVPRISFAPLVVHMNHHLGETRHHWEVVTRILRENGFEPGKDRCLAMEGLIKGGDAHLDEVDVPAIRDLMVVAHCLRIEHYEIAAYSITAVLARKMQFFEEAEELEAILAQEQTASSKLQSMEDEIFRIAAEVTLN